MTLKEKFNSIDQSRITADQKSFLDKMKNVTKDFTLENKEVNDKVEGALDKMITSFKEKMPDAIKTSTKVVVPKTAKSKKTTKVVSKTTKPKRTVMSVAKEIRKEGESWKDAQKRASDIIKEDKADVSEVVKKELDRINKFINSRAELKGISGTNIKRDAVRTAKPRGVRTVTKSGETSNQYGTFSNKLGRRYWESRDRHADRLAPNYPKDAPLLANGGELSGVNLNFDFETEGDAEYEYPQEVEKIRLLRERINFDEVRGSIDYGKTKDNTNLKFYKNGKLVMTLKGDYDTDSEILDTDVEILGSKHKINYHPYDSMGGVDYFALKRELEKTVFADGGYLTNPTFGNFQNQVFADGGDFQAGVYEKGGRFQTTKTITEMIEDGYSVHDAFDTYEQAESVCEEKDLKSGKVVIVRDKNYYTIAQKLKKYALGGTVVTDLAGHTGGGDGGLNAGMPLDGFSNTAYTGLVGETGAMSSGELFMAGGKVDKNFNLAGYKRYRMFDDFKDAKEHVDMDRKKYPYGKKSVVIKKGDRYEVWSEPVTGIETGNRVYELGGTLPSGVSQPYMITEALGNPAQHFAKGGGVNEEVYYKRKKYALGGTVVTDLAGHTGGSLGTGDPSILSGFSNTSYTGLVGETGAMSSGEMFMAGGSVEKKIYGIEKDFLPFDFKLYTYDEAKVKSQEYMIEYPNSFFQPRQYNDMRNELPAIERMYMPILDKDGKFYDADNTPFSQGDLAEYELGGTLPDGSSQSYIITEALGNPAQHFLKGGAIKNQYEGRTPEDVWDNLTQKQRYDFLQDHRNEFPTFKNNLYELAFEEYDKLPIRIELSFKNHVKTGQYKAGGMLDANERYVLEIKGLTGLRKEAIESYIAENNLSDNDVLNIVIGLGRKQLKGTDVASAVVGKKGNALSKKVIEFAKDNRGMKLEEGGKIDAFTLRMVKGTAGKPDEAMTEPRSVQFARGGGVSQKEKRQEYLENLLMLESEVWDKIGADSGGQIRQDEKLLRKYAEGVGSVMEKEGIQYGSFDEEDYEYFQDGNSHLLNEFLVWNNYYEPTMTKKEKAWRLKMYEEDVREKKKYSYVSNPEVITLNSTKSKSDKKYIVNADIVSVTVKKGGKEVTYSGKDVLNGANILKDGGGIENKASYFSKNNIVSVKLKDGETIKPANGYWVEKDATPIKNKEDMSSESKMMSFEEFSKKLPDVYDVYYGEKGVVYKAKYNRWADRMSYYKNGRRTDKNVVSLKGAYDTYKLDFENKNDKKMAYGGGVDRFSEYSNDALYDMMINLSRYENTESDIQMIKDELEKRKGKNLTIEEDIDLTNDYVLRVRKPAMPTRNLSNLELAEKYNSGAYEFMGKDKMATGGGVDYEYDAIAYAKTKGKESIDWDKELREYAGSEYSKLTAREKEEIISDMQRDWNSRHSFATGGGISKFKMLSDKVAKNYEGKRVKPEFQKEYGKVYSKEEAKEVGDKVAGKVKANQKMATGGEAKKGGKGGIMILAKQIRKDGESWQDALKRASKQLK